MGVISLSPVQASDVGGCEVVKKLEALRESEGSKKEWPRNHTVWFFIMHKLSVNHDCAVAASQARGGLGWITRSIELRMEKGRVVSLHIALSLQGWRLTFSGGGWLRDEIPESPLLGRGKLGKDAVRSRTSGA